MTNESDEEIAREAYQGEYLTVDQYNGLIKKAKNANLKRILKHNRKDEISDHAKKLGKFVLEHEAKEKRVRV